MKLKLLFALAQVALAASTAKPTTSQPTHKPTTSQPTPKPTAVLDLMDCSDMADQLCPNSQPAPEVEFSALGGELVATSTPCCKANYLQCQNQIGQAACKVLATYTLTPGQGNSEVVCPIVQPECTCQQALALERSMSLKFCPESPVCCPTCECHGDPHCTSFDRKAPTAVWAVCDDRDKSCIHKASTCAKTTYNGQKCVWAPLAGSSGECHRPADSPTPIMNMYTKQYKSYFNSTDTVLHTFTINLALSSYGVISTVTIKDAGVTAVFSVNSAGKCATSSSAYPISTTGAVYIKNLPSGVWIQLQCVDNAPKTPQRWDVVFVKDPWHVLGAQSHNPLLTFGGYCPTNLIPENTGGNPGGCSIMDRQVTMYYGCSAATALGTCKAQFCKKYANYFAFPSGTAGNTQQAKCVAYTTVEGSSNLLYAACALNTLPAGAINPDNCLEDYNCKVCVDMINDFPDQIATALNAPVVVPSMAPTIACPGNLVAVGLNRKSLSAFQSGVQIDFNNNGVWTGVFALLDEEIAACGGCGNVLFVNGSVSSNLPLLNYGQYQIRQCFGLDTDPLQPLCTGPPGYNATVRYSNPLAVASVSRTLGTLFKQGGLVCSSKLYPKCPLDYQCCIWDRATQTVAWELCMDTYHGGSTVYTQCGK
ncbi:hypothetical protein BASA82_000573 [Batrachochytrium salamandrivorans]|nr:hypothetical protein BASA81_003644 [Batrachochytrium salamandrivorans]KAH9262388.1 hypothetical protein BASA82_000573 [Batrachochytrium salamandrivorans]